jgi:hypothetical protein
MFRANDIIYSLYLLSEYNKIDYLNETISDNNYNWNLLYNFIEKSGHVELLESYNLIKSEIVNGTDIQHVYEIITLKNDKFEVYLNYTDTEKSYDLANKRKITYELKNNNELSNNYSELMNKLKIDNGIICMIMFKDSVDRTTITGNIGVVSGLELFRTLNDVVEDSFFKSDSIQKVTAVGLRISNSEKNKRLKFYQMLHKKYWSNIFSNIFIDDISENKNGYTLLYFSK